MPVDREEAEKEIEKARLELELKKQSDKNWILAFLKEHPDKGFTLDEIVDSYKVRYLKQKPLHHPPTLFEELSGRMSWYGRLGESLLEGFRSRLWELEQEGLIESFSLEGKTYYAIKEK